jgi:cardiolipin synthase
MELFQGEFWHGIKIIFVLEILAQLWAAGHAITYKRDPRSAAGWTAVILLAPITGALAYWLLGINRLRSKAKKRLRHFNHHYGQHGPHVLSREDKDKLFGLDKLSQRVTKNNLHGGNQITPLINGEQAFPAMLKAIENSKHSIGLSTYIFDYDQSGIEFARALVRAADRGVDVRVLVDALGIRYSFPKTILSEFKNSKVKFSRFMETRWPWHFHYSQLRNHRKLLVVDGCVGYTGGMNIRHDHCVASAEQPTADIHFEMKGPIIADMQQVFLDDWAFASNSPDLKNTWPVDQNSYGDVQCRIVSDGPDEELDKLRWVIMGALSIAKSNVRIVTPYFLPDRSLTDAIGLAALRGVRVEIILPENNNLKMVQWASFSMLWQVIEKGCRVFLSKKPFDHSKVMIVDDYWCFIGSTNWDARSLRLNFEMNVECYQKAFAQSLIEIFEQKKMNSRLLSLADVDNRLFWQRLRDGACRLFTPYL